MEEYLQNMKNLRSQMNDFENEAAHVSVEEEKLKTEIQTFENDIRFAQSETKRLKEETDGMVEITTEIRRQILEKLKKIANLEIEFSTLLQTLELLQKEKVTLAAKIKERKAHYAEVLEDMNAKLQELEVWLDSQKFNNEVTKTSVMTNGSTGVKCGGHFTGR